MRFETGQTTVGTAGTAVQLNASASTMVKELQVKALAGNSGVVYVGGPTVSASTGWELSAGQTFTLTYQGETINANTFWVDAASSNDKVSWSMLVNG